MKYLIITDDDQANTREIELDTHEEVYKVSTYENVDDKFVGPIVKDHAVVRPNVPGMFIYFLKRFNPQNAGGAYQQDNGYLWIEGYINQDGIRIPVIFEYTDGYGKDWMLD